MTQGVILVDHGSRRAESNAMLLQVVAEFERQMPQYSIVEPAHMELAEPDIATAFGNCVTRGARRVVVFPYFLLPGRHWSQDIPDLVSAAAENHAGVEWLVTAPIGIHSMMAAIIDDRIQSCLQTAETQSGDCAYCNDEKRCRLRSG